MKKLFVSGIAMLLALLNGCANYQQAQHVKEQSAALAQLKADCDALYTNANISILDQKIPRNPKDATLQQLSDPSRPSEDERQAISRYNTARLKCAAKNLDIAAKYAGAAAADVIVNIQQRTDALVLSLYQMQLTYGQFNTSRQKNNQDLLAALYRLAAQQQAQQQAIAQQEEESREAARQQAAAYLLSHPIQAPQIQYTPMQVTRPVQTTCFRNGPYTSCTSQ